jgi:hypothetical protein
LIFPKPVSDVIYSTVLLGNENPEKGNALRAEAAEILVIKSLRLKE